MAESASQIPPLENGDHLSRAEFERRYHAMPQLKKAELVEGIVFMPSPLHFQKHAEPHSHIVTWLGHYAAYTPGLRLGDNPTLRLDAANEYQPDAVLCVPERAGGRTCLGPDDFLEGPPELVIEIASTSASYDMHEKRLAYCRSGVQEYLVWLVRDRTILWYYRDEDDYRLLQPQAGGVVGSAAFPGLLLDHNALLRGDLARVLEVLQGGLQAEGHQRFADRVRGR